MTRDDADAWLARDPLPADPMPLLQRWLDEAFAAGQQPNPHAMALATADPDGSPSVRMVLCQEIDVAGGSLVFYTNRTSRKGRALAARARAALAFHWGPQERQARLEGPVLWTSDAESDAYFASRPAEAQLGAWASDQSEPIATRAALLERLVQLEQRFGVPARPQAPGSVPRPPHWGGYRVLAERVELWRSRPRRLHDRALWSRPLAVASPGPEPGPWQVVRLQP